MLSRHKNKTFVERKFDTSKFYHSYIRVFKFAYIVR